MAISDTQRDLLSYLDAITREFNPNKLDRHTTVDIARAMSISRNLCSQYLNELVRRGLAVKAGVRPIYYFHRHDLERYLQARIDRAGYATLEELMGLRGARPGEGFERAVGYDLSLASAVSQMRVALEYPPCGLPVLIAGVSGTGKTFMAELMLAYGKNAGLFDDDAELTAVDCSRYLSNPADIVRDFEGGPGAPGWLDTAKGGLLLFKYIDLLPASQQEYLFTHALFAARAEQGSSERGLRFIFTTAAPCDSGDLRRFKHRLPITAELPALHRRTPQERRDLVLHFLRDEGRRMGMDVLIAPGALRCLINAQYEDNISELRRSITNACAEAYLARGGSSRIEVHAYNLPANVLMSVDARHAEGDGRLLDVTRLASAPRQQRLTDVLDGVLASYRAFCAQRLDSSALDVRIAESVAALERELAHGEGMRGPKLAAFDRLLGEGVTGINDELDCALSHATARLLAQLSYLQIWPDEDLPRWKAENASDVERLLTLLAVGHPAAAHVADRVAEFARRVLGIALDAPMRFLLLAHIALLERAGAEEAVPRDAGSAVLPSRSAEVESEPSNCDPAAAILETGRSFPA